MHYSKITRTFCACLRLFAAKKLRSVRVLLPVFLGLLSSSAPAQTTIQNTTYASGQNRLIDGPSTIAANTSVNVASGASIKFRVNSTGSITLGPGFTASAGSTFRAFLFIDSDGDGIDDFWELSHGLNPNNPADAAQTDSNGRTYLVEYQLGLEPGHASQTTSASSVQLNTHRPPQ